MSLRALLLTLIALSTAYSWAETPKKPREVIDLGSLQIDGAARGPEIQYIDSQRLNDRAAGKLLIRQLEKLEGTLLSPEALGTSSGKGGRK